MEEFFGAGPDLQSAVDDDDWWDIIIIYFAAVGCIITET